jgi:hypothetical protein
MRKIALMALTALPLFAGFFPATVHTSVSTIENGTLSLNQTFSKNGMSGIVIHNYGNGLNAITAHIQQTSSEGNAKVIDKNIIHHNALPSIKTAIEAGDNVVGGYLYNNVLLLAPDASTYNKITSSYAKNWTHPDLFALYLEQEGESIPTRESLATFAQIHQIGLVYIVRKNSAVLLDPISGKIVSEKSVSKVPTTAQYPFYMHLDEIKTGWFSKDTKGNYYQIMESL